MVQWLLTKEMLVLVLLQTIATLLTDGIIKIAKQAKQQSNNHLLHQQDLLILY